MTFLSKLEDDLFSFNGELKGSAEFNAVMDFGLFLLTNENLDLKKMILAKLVKRVFTLEDLIKLGRRAVQSSLYDLEQEGFISRKFQNEKVYYEFDRAKTLFRIQNELKEAYEKLKERKEFYTSNTLFYCELCNKRFEYIKAMEKDFHCCREELKPFDATDAIQNITKYLSFIKEKLEYLKKI